MTRPALQSVANRSLNRVVMFVLPLMSYIMCYVLRRCVLNILYLFCQISEKRKLPTSGKHLETVSVWFLYTSSNPNMMRFYLHDAHYDLY